MILSEGLNDATGRLTAAGVEGARRDARLLMAAALSVGPEVILADPGRPLSGAEGARFESMIARRLKREPVSRILGRREFWSLPFRVTRATLDPRPDSETLIEAVLAHLADPAAPRRLLDLGTGTGCLLLALLSELPGAEGLGVDRSEAAVLVARENAESLGLAGRAGFATGDWAQGLDADWDVVVCNPPYIAESEIPALAPEVGRYDPAEALAGGGDGLAAYRRLVPQVAGILAPDGLFALELGAGQAAAVSALAMAAGLRVLGCRRDLRGVERCLLACRG